MPLIKLRRKTTGSVALGDLADGEVVQEESTGKLVARIAGVLKKFYPGEAFAVGAVYVTVDSANPATTLGYGTWVVFGAGRTLVGVDSGQTEFDTVEETGGSKTHTLTTNEMPSHTHTQDSHNHTQNSHNHTQNSHNHTQDAHTHSGVPVTSNFNKFGTSSGAVINGSGNSGGATATNQATTATNIATTATNQATTATNQNTGGDGAHNNLQPYVVVYFWKRTA